MLVREVRVTSFGAVKAGSEIVNVHHPGQYTFVHGYRPKVDSPPIDANIDTFIHTIILRNDVHTLAHPPRPPTFPQHD